MYRDVLEVRHCKAIGPRLLWDDLCELTWRRHAVPPVLDEVLATVGGDPRLMLDLKGPSLAVADRVATQLRALAPGVPLTVCTKQWRMLDAFAGELYIRKVFSAASPWQLSRLRARLGRQRVFGVSIHRKLLTPRIVRELRRATDVVMVWPVDTPAALDDARRLGVTAVISKNLPMLRRLLADRTVPVNRR